MVAIPAILGLAGTLAQVSATNAANRQQYNLGMANLREDKRNNRRMFDLATAPRKDADGNVTLYSPDSGFETLLAPLIQSIVNAQNEERYKSLAIDAPQQRAARKRKDNRSKQAGAIADELIEKYSRRQKPDKKALIADEIYRTFQRGTPSQQQQLPDLITRAMRTGNNEALKAATMGNSGSNNASLVDAVAQAKLRGQQQTLATENAENSIDLSEIMQILGIANDSDTTNLLFGNDTSQATGRADGALQSLLQAVQAGGQQVSATMARNAARRPEIPNYEKLFASIGTLFPKQKANLASKTQNQNGF